MGRLRGWFTGGPPGHPEVGPDDRSTSSPVIGSPEESGPDSSDTLVPEAPEIPPPPAPIQQDAASPAEVAEWNLSDLMVLLADAGLFAFRMRGYQPARLRLGVVATPGEWRRFCRQHLADTDWWIGQAGWERPLNHPKPFRRLEPEKVMHLYRKVAPAGGGRPITDEACVDVDLWTEYEDGRLETSSGNPVTLLLESRDQAELMNPVGPLADELSEPVDVVFTWVTDADPDWRADYQRTVAEYRGDELLPLSRTAGRFRDTQELRYAIRSVLANMPWVNRIHILTGNHAPDWLRTSDRIRLVPHSAVLPASALPTFNSHAIESVLHRIPDLTEHFVYFNDDTFVCNPVLRQKFFEVSGLPVVYLSKRPIGRPGHPIPTSPAIAAENARGILEQLHGRTIDRTLLHVPHAVRRRNFELLWERAPEAIETTLHAKIRRKTDVPPILLQQWDALLAGNATSGRSSYRTVDIGDEGAEDEMTALRSAKRLPDFLSLNQRDDAGESALRALADTMRWLFPFRFDEFEQGPEQDLPGEPPAADGADASEDEE